jgi:hypothetical protein
VGIAHHEFAVLLFNWWAVPTLLVGFLRSFSQNMRIMKAAQLKGTNVGSGHDLGA